MKVNYKFRYKNSLTVLLLSVIAIFSSCTNLDEEVYSELTSENFTPSESDVLSLMISAYTPTRNLFAGNQRWWDLQEEPGNCIVTATREAGGWDDGGRYKRNHSHTWTSEQPQFMNFWNRAYEGISKCNRVIMQFETDFVKIPVGKEKYIAELKALRAIYFYALLDMYGNVPVTIDFTDLELPVTTKRADVFKFVENELLDNMANLSDKDDATTYGRITQSVANAILMRLYLNATVYNGTERLDDCIAQCNKIIGKGSYSLAANYLDPFKPDNQNCKENIFVIPCDVLYAQGFVLFLKWYHHGSQKVYAMSPSAWNGCFVSPQFLYSYQQGDKRRTLSWLQGPQKDPGGNVIMTYYNDINDISWAKDYSGYRVGKYQPQVGLSGGNLSNDFVMVRYAEVLYAKAECLLRKGGAANEEEAAALVSGVRKRVFDDQQKATIDASVLKGGSKYPWGIYVRARQATYTEEIYTPGDPLPATITEQQSGNDITLGGMLDEWCWEFTSEAQNRQHLIRFGAYTTKKWFNHSPNTAFGDKVLLFAIPKTAIDKNNKLTQNPGY